MAPEFAAGHALLIAVNESAVPAYALPDVAKDVEAIHRVLTHPDRCAYPTDNISLLRDAGATRNNILNGLTWLKGKVEADTSGQATAVIYYSGHGWRDTAVEPHRFYLLPYDVNQAQLRATALRAEDFADAVAAINARRLLVILDCCRAGGMGIKDAAVLPADYVPASPPAGGLMAAAPVSGTPGAKGLEQLQRGQGRAILNSSTGEQISNVRKDGQMSIFTYHLIEALTGHTRPADGDTEVWVSDLMSHVSRRVPASALVDWNREQTPDYDVHGNFPVALLLGGRAWGKDILPPGPLQAAQPREPEDAATYSHIGGSVIHGDVTFRDGTFVGGSQTTTTNYYSTLAGQPVAAAPDPGLGLEGLFAELRTAVASAPLHARAEAEAAVEALQWEVEKGPQADDKVMAGLVKKLADLAPATGPTLSLLFATPPLSGLAGNATQFVLDLIKQN